MSKANRRRQRPGSQPPTNRPTSPPPNPAVTSPMGDPTGTEPYVAGTGAAGTAGAGAAGARAQGAGSASAASMAHGTTGAGRPTGSNVRPGTPRPTGTAGRPPASRHGRRERQRAMYQPSFVERYRTAIILVAALAGVALLAAFVFLSAAQPAYGCSTIWTPSPTASPAPSATPNLGYVQPDMGRDHVAVGTKVTYTYCAPASGSHDNQPGTAGPIPARVYGPGDNVNPQGWIHNLEHGGLVLLYQGTSPGASDAGQQQLRAFYDNFPPGPVCGTIKGAIGPIIARFDQMSTPFQVIVWGRVLPLDTFDQDKILAFWNQWGERTNPEPQCQAPVATPGTTSSPPGSAAPSAAPSDSTPAPSATAAPSGSAAPSPS
ncbi:MAG: DUF3105 domain-containing protein [Chloroflexota bacterium]